MRERAAGFRALSFGGVVAATVSLAALVPIGSASAQDQAVGIIPVAVVDGPALTLEAGASLSFDKGTVGVADRGDIITYTYVVTNNGTVTVSDVHIDVSDAGKGVVPLSFTEALIGDERPYNDSSDATANDGRWSALAPGDTVIFAATYAVTQGDIDRQ